jgi:hypothetical protein
VKEHAVLRYLDLTLRFVLELTALWLAGTWGWIAHADPWRWILAIGLPLAAAIVWGTFRRRSRSAARSGSRSSSS